MGEIFRQPNPNQHLAWTGERATPEADRQVRVEHYHRYCLARSLVRDLDVLDVAAGEGFGGFFLAQTARSVIGVELDPASVEHARRLYGRPNLHFLAGDARALPLGDDSVDAVVSFETIEHFYEHRTFLAEIRRVLRPGGRLIISSPDRDVYSPVGSPPNPFHVHELTRTEFHTLLAETFPHIALLGQRVLKGSAIIAEGVGAGLLTFEERAANAIEASVGLSRPVYLVAIASDEPLPLPPSSLYVHQPTLEEAHGRNTDEDLRRQQALDEAGTYARHVEAELARREGDLAAAREELGRLAAERGVMAAAVEDAGAHARHVETELARREGDLAAAREELGRLAAGIASADARTADQRAELDRLHGALEEERDKAVSRAAHLKAFDRAFAEQMRDLGQARRALAEASSEVEARGNRLDMVEGELRSGLDMTHDLQVRLAAALDAQRALEARLSAVLGSSTWRVTRPIRHALARTPRLAQLVRRGSKLAWWTISLQLPGRLTARQALLAADGVPEKAPAIEVQENGEADKAPPAAPPSSRERSIREVVTAEAKAELDVFLASGERLVLPRPERPDVSVVVVLWQNAHWTLRCLRALREQTGPSFEVILVDNRSGDVTPALLSRVDGADLLFNETNEGFLLASNRGAARARGRTILLLNSDAFLHPVALATALATLDSAADIGAVGGRLILPDGRLQEAGSVVWSDGGTLGYGRGLEPDAGEAMFRRDVDYCSAAFLLTLRTLWHRLGGFDEGFAPAYYEETDYCLRLREAGFRTMYEPDAVADHIEFGSEGKAGDAHARMLRNRERFRARHEAELRHALPPDVANLTLARSPRPREARRILVIDNEVPLGALGSGYPRARDMLRMIAESGWSVSFLPLHQLEVDWRAARAEVPVEIEILSRCAHLGLANLLRARRGFYHAVLVSRPDNMHFVRSILDTAQAPGEALLCGTRLIYDAEALFTGRDILRARLAGQTLPEAEVEARLRAEVAITHGADAVVCVTEREAEVFRARQDKPVVVLSHPVEAATEAPGFTGRRGFLFIGRLLEHEAPNWQGLSWFLQECWPLVRERLPAAVLTVVGHRNADDAALRAPGVLFRGAVADLSPLYSACRVFVSPIRFAAGVPIKILEAAAAGVPVAGTRLMAEQLGWTPGREMVAEDDPHALATAIVALHEEEARWEATRRAATVRLQADHSGAAFRDRLRGLLDALVPPPPRGAPRAILPKAPSSPP